MKRKQEFDHGAVQLATRIPNDLRRRMRLHCVEVDTSLTAFISEALTERLMAVQMEHLTAVQKALKGWRDG